MATFDVARARRETPGCEGRIHLNNAGASLMPQPVVQAIKGHIDLEAVTGGYEAAAIKADALEGVYRSAARLVGGQAEEIALFDGVTRAWNSLFHGAVTAMRIGEGDVVLTCLAEYCSNHTAMIQLSRRFGFTIEVIPDDGHGQIDLEALERALKNPAVKLLSLVHVPTNGGLVNPAEEAGALAKGAGVPMFLDAAQSAGQIPLNVDAIGCDVLVAAGRKFLRGPRGIALAWVNGAVMERIEPMLLNMKATTLIAEDDYEVAPGAARYESWERSAALDLGLGAAIDYALDWGIAPIQARITELADFLRAQLSDIRGVEVKDKGRHKCGIVTMTLGEHEPAQVMSVLFDQSINVTVSPPHMAFIDSNRRGLPPMLRASVHYYNTEEELERFCSALAQQLT
ncbi:MAG: aminotransferase class V-fold PLP-dependent enzyme [Alphaproteobacteria bacterium]